MVCSSLGKSRRDARRLLQRRNCFRRARSATRNCVGHPATRCLPEPLPMLCVEWRWLHSELLYISIKLPMNGTAKRHAECGVPHSSEPARMSAFGKDVTWLPSMQVLLKATSGAALACSRSEWRRTSRTSWKLTR